jgi:phenol 2-monooxygenase
MQFYLNGFRSGDPGHSDAVKDALPEEVDVLIVGCGPTGLTLAAQLAAFPSIRTRIIEQKAGPLQLGQADGVACRTMEMFQAFGFAERVLREAYWVNETSFWTPNQNEPGRINRARVVQDVEDGLSEFPHVILNQARIHEFYLDVMRHGSVPLEPAYARRLVSLKMDSASLRNPSAFPLTARIERVDGGLAGAPEIVRARYVVGCDGARSAVRGFIGRTMKGDAANQAWGVMDVLAVTDFPDIRRKAAIHSATDGSMLIIPREGGYLVRMYVELDKLAENQRVANLDVTPEHLIAAATRILRPYSFEVKEVAWWSVYEIGHRLCDGFDDCLSEADQGRLPRVFIAGDACHTHSPKAGQGMNVSMQDTFNLGWKLAAVLTGRAEPHLLATYSEERKAIAKDLFDFDHKWARMFSARPKGAPGATEDAVDPAEFQEYFLRHGRYTAGVATCYKPSLLTGPSTFQDLATGFVIGMRFHSAPVIRLADAKPVQLGHVVRADGRWRMFAFADLAAPSDPASRLRELCAFLETSPSSPLKRHTAAGADIDDAIELIAVFQQAHRLLSVSELPGLLLPRKGRYGLIDYEKAYCPDKQGPDIFDLRGIDRASGALVIVRPDQYVAHVLPLDDYKELQRFFGAFMTDAASPMARRQLAR